MSQVFKFFGTGVLGIAVAGVCLALPAQSCYDITASDVPQVQLTRRETMKVLATSIKRSLIVELLPTSDEEPKMPPPSGSTVGDFAKMMGTGEAAECSVENGVIHIYQPSALSSRRNALNYTLPQFDMPSTAEAFVTKLRTHLKDAFQPAGTAFNGSDAGATSNEAHLHPLKSERLVDVQTRKLLFNAASQAPIIYVAEVYNDSSKSPQDTWDETERTLIFQSIR